MPTRRIYLCITGAIASGALLVLVLVSPPRAPRAEPTSPSPAPPRAAAASKPADDPPPALAASEGSVPRLLAWADRDFPAALASTSGLVVREERQRLQSELCRQLAARSPAAAADLASHLRLDEAEEDVVAGIVARWTRDAPAAALDWTLAQPDGERRARWLAPFVQLLATSSPPEAAALIAETMPPGPERTRVTLDVVEVWAALDFHASLDWVAHFPDEGIREAAITRLARIEPARPDPPGDPRLTTRGYAPRPGNPAR